MFVFGHTAEQVNQLRASGYDPKSWIQNDPHLARAIEVLVSGPIGKANPGTFQPIVDMLQMNDRYLHCADFGSYVAKQEEAAKVWQDAHAWARKSILSVARMGWFSSDRTVREYADQIWGASSITGARG